MKPKDLYNKLVLDQQYWIQKCGGDLAGYIKNYPSRTLENVTAIYQADINELKRITNKLEDLNGYPLPRSPTYG